MAQHPRHKRTFRPRPNPFRFRPALEPLEERTLLSAGALDPTFGVGGKVTTDFSPGFDGAGGVVLQTGGKILVAGYDNADFALARYNADGSLDTSFGTGGKVSTDFAGGPDGAFGLAVQANGKIVAAGFATVNGTRDFAAARYNTDGGLDTSFGTGGKVTTDFAHDLDVAFSVVLQPGGKVVLGGSAALRGTDDFALVRYNPDGSLDPSFGGNGKITTDFAGGFDEGAAFLQPNGKILMVGYANADADQTTGEFALARYSADGLPDPGFGTGGKVTTNFSAGWDSIANVGFRPNGDIVAAGVTNFAWDGIHGDFALARYHADGSLDPSFGTSGKVITDFTGGSDYTSSCVLQTDGKIVVAGSANYTLVDGKADFALVRYNANGSLDSTFGSGGKVTTDFAGGEDFAGNVALAADGKIVAVGWATVNGSPDVALARYENDRLQFSSATYTVGENGGSATIAVTRTAGTTGEVSVLAATSNGTAVANGDYTETAVLLTFHEGETSKTFSIPVHPDVWIEGSETVHLTLGSPQGASIGSPHAAVLTILDQSGPIIKNIQPIDVTPLVLINPLKSRFDRGRKLHRQTIRLQNQSSIDLSGPLRLVLEGLGRKVRLLNKAGITRHMAPLGQPYVMIPLHGLLRPGESITLMLEFTKSRMRRISYVPHIFGGDLEP
jgi:uncharacterized delta-60 repeat protein